MIQSEKAQAIFLTILGAMGTSLGAVIVLIHPKKTLDYRRLGLLQGLAAGLMLSLSFLDLMPESIESLGVSEACLWFFIGVLFFMLVTKLIPEASVESMISIAEDEDEPSAVKEKRKVRGESSSWA